MFIEFQRDTTHCYPISVALSRVLLPTMINLFYKHEPVAPPVERLPPCTVFETCLSRSCSFYDVVPLFCYARNTRPFLLSMKKKFFQSCALIFAIWSKQWSRLSIGRPKIQDTKLCRFNFRKITL